MKSKFKGIVLIISFVLFALLSLYLFRDFLYKLNIFGSAIVAFVNFIGIASSAILISWQVSNQHKNTIAQQQEKFKDELNLKLYSEIAVCIKKSSALLLESEQMIRKFPSNLADQIFHEQELGLDYKEVDDKRASIFRES